MSRKAVEYALGLQIADLDSKRVFMVLAGLTSPRGWPSPHSLC